MIDLTLLVPRHLLFAIAFLPLSFASMRAADTTTSAAPSPASLATAAPHHTFVIVHGAWGGGWAFREVDRVLTADGHKVYRPTLTGQGEKVHLATRDTGLTTHVTDIVNVILFEDLHDVVLVGHSYGGMVITGVMDRVPERIRQVIFLDAAVPDDGESMNSLRNRTPTPEQVASGFIMPGATAAAKPIPHDVPQPLKTWTEPVTFKNPDAKKNPRRRGRVRPEPSRECPAAGRSKNPSQLRPRQRPRLGDADIRQRSQRPMVAPQGTRRADRAHRRKAMAPGASA